MIDSLPTVQRYRGCRRISHCYDVPNLKRAAHRTRRRQLRAVMHEIEHDPDLFDDETFDAKSLSSWEIV